ncbi:ADP-ribosylglycohydrolase family protein [bacterium]|nr:ADP-ribosylglycohydrolase family protein [bacterium]
MRPVPSQEHRAVGDIIKNSWLWLTTGDLGTELRQLEDEGKDATSLTREFRRLIALGNEALFLPANQQKAGDLLDRAQQLPTRADYPFIEPSDLPSIRRRRARGPRAFKTRLSRAALHDHILGAWLGRCAGCLLGKPVEGVRTPDLWGFLKLSRQWPLRDYIRFGVRGKAKTAYPHLASRARFDRIDHMPIDDDTNYTTTGFLIVKRCGADFTPADVAQFWMANLPLLATCTAERVAYRNFALQIQPPHSAAYRNPYREWIGAQIRADAFGYLNIGNPQRAADFAWRDASISHIKNGIYGEMLMAALIAAAPFCDGPAELLQVGLSEIPKGSRLYADINETLAWHHEGLTYDEAVAMIHEKWDETTGHDWCHTNSNAAICAVALLWGEGDFGTSVCRAVQPCFDTDCNGATVGSILGMMLGAKAMPAQWTGRLNNTLKTSLQGYETVDIEAIAHETATLARAIR